MTPVRVPDSLIHHWVAYLTVLILFSIEEQMGLKIDMRLSLSTLRTVRLLTLLVGQRFRTSSWSHHTVSCSVLHVGAKSGN